MTLVEVIFAIGVVLIGLLGLLSVLPLAGNRAQDAVGMNEGAALADAIANQVHAANLINSNSLSALDGASLQSSATPRVIDPFCIDPMFSAAAPAANESYNANFFPFYVRNHDPLLDPSVSASATSPSGFDGQPRMRRAFPTVLLSIAATNRLEVARTMTESSDDVPLVRPKDRSKPAALTGLGATGTSAISFGKLVPTGEYTWVITVDPTEDSRFAAMSVVVMRNRDRLTEFPASNRDNPRGNALAERVTLVTGASGFSGGGGGTVILTSAVNTLSNFKSGDWLMLSKNVAPALPNRPRHEVHRWYRIVAAAGDAQIVRPTSNTDVGGVTIPTPGDASVQRDDATNTNAVWQRRVVLDGPDWNFPPPPFNPATFANSTAGTTNSLTYATLFEDVVAVAERTISLADF